jgi:hypothetical protein
MFAAVEAADTAAFMAEGLASGTLVAAETADAAAIEGTAGITYGILAIYDDPAWLTKSGVDTATDIAEIVGEVSAAGQLAAVEPDDVAAITSEAIATGVLVAVEEATDSLAIVAESATFAALAAREPADSASFVGEIAPAIGILTANENADRVAIRADKEETGVLEAAEALDQVSIRVRLWANITDVCAPKTVCAEGSLRDRDTDSCRNWVTAVGAKEPKTICVEGKGGGTDESCRDWEKAA